MLSNNSEKAWKYFGKNNPYYGVFSWDKFRSSSLTKESKNEFFDSGEEYIDKLLQIVESNRYENFNLQKAKIVDFGCGVGRILIPLSKKCKEIVGVDISEDMIKEAKSNCLENQIRNTRFFSDIDSFSEKFDMIHSYIVLQHIPEKTGLSIISKLIDYLNDYGIGVIHITYAKDKTPLELLKYNLFKQFPILYYLRNILKGVHFKEPMMQMNSYNLNMVFKTLQDKKCHKVHTRFTNHGNNCGLMLFFQKIELSEL